MALQVWLPLNGNLKNQGLADVTVTNNGATINNGGKIGQCYSFDGSDDKIQIGNAPTPEDVSVAMWFKRNSTTNTRQFLYTQWGGITLELNAGNKITCSVNTVSGQVGYCTTTEAVTSDSGWTHIVFSFKNGIGTSLYVNGVLIKSATVNESIKWTTTTGNIGYFSTYFNGLINDFRIYDHCLSLKEIKEISKGLVLHYKLDQNCLGEYNNLLPNGVELYDYIEGNGPQYIDSGWTPDITKSFQINTRSSLHTANRAAIFSNYSNNLTKLLTLEHYASGNLRIWNNGDLKVHTLSQEVIGNIKVNWDPSTSTISGTTQTEGENEVSFSKSSASLSQASSSTYLIFTDRRNGASSVFIGKLRVYNISVREENILVKNFVPCTYFGEPGMWDTVTNQFYGNSGTGQFTLGNKIVLKEYEYLQSSGTQRIDTGIIPDLTLDTYFKVETLSGAANSSPIIGTRVGTSNPGRYFPIAYSANSSTQLRTTLGNSDTAFSYTSGIFEGQFLPTQLTSTINGVARSLTNNGFTKTENNTLQIFGTTGYGTSYYYTKAKVYYVQLKRNNQLVRDFVPVSYNGTPGLWDKVEYKFYGNSGSGSFTVEDPITTAQDSSGYENNGTIVDSLSVNNWDTPRYENCTKFNGTSYIYLPSPPTTEVKTVSLWVKWDTMDFSGNYASQSVIFVDNGSKIGLGLYSGGILLITSGAGNGYAYPKTNLVANTWYHFVIISTGTTTRDLYINGIKQTKNSSSSSWSFSINQLQLGRRSTTTDGFKGQISDFRLYTTVLSDDDVLELYNTSAIVDNLGNTYGYQFNENGQTPNLLDLAQKALTNKQWKDCLFNSSSQPKAVVTLTDYGLRVYREPNNTSTTSGSGEGKQSNWGGFVLTNTDNMFGLQNGHTYLIQVDVKGKSDRALSDYGWRHHVGWNYTNTGIAPAPTNTVLLNPITANFNTEEWQQLSYKFTISDSVYKVATTTYQYHTEGETYLAYYQFKFGWTYGTTGEIGTDVYFSNLRMFDVTSIPKEININKQGILDTFQLSENENVAFIDYYCGSTSNQFIEI